VTDLPDRAAWLTVHAQLEATDLTPVLPTIGVPTLVLCRGGDRASQPDARRTAQAIAGARLVVIPHIGHLLPARALEPIAKGFFPMH
jgi:3-oxoadipate enol-lactonase